MGQADTISEERRLVYSGRLRVQLQFSPHLELSELASTFMDLLALLQSFRQTPDPILDEDQAFYTESAAQPFLIEEIHTGGSVEFVISVGGVGGVVLTGLALRQLLWAGKAAAEGRKAWYEGSKAREEARALRLANDAQERALQPHEEEQLALSQRQLRRLNSRVRHEAKLARDLAEASEDPRHFGDDLETPAVPVIGLTRRTRPLALELVESLDQHPNIDEATVNGITIYSSPRLEEDEDADDSGDLDDI
jgi:hypothetical protein